MIDFITEQKTQRKKTLNDALRVMASSSPSGLSDQIGT